MYTVLLKLGKAIKMLITNNFCHFSNFLYLITQDRKSWSKKIKIIMKASEAIEKIRVLLGVEDAVEETQIQLATATLIDGTVVEVEGELEVGKPLFVQTEEGPIPAPAGKHQTTNDLLITVDEAGVITEIVEVEAEEPEVEVEVEMEAEEEVKVEMEEEKVKIEMAEKLIQLLEPYLKQIDEMKEKMAAQDEVIAKLSKEPAAKPIKRNDITNDRISAVDRLVKFRK